MRCFTVTTNRKIPRARILCNSLKRYHPDWTVDVIFCEPIAEIINQDEEPFDNLFTLDMLDIEDLATWLFKHNESEIPAAVKGPALAYYFEIAQTDKIIYFDPNIAAFNSLDALANLLDEHPIILTPHMVQPEVDPSLIEFNELFALNYGVFNSAFFAVRGDGQGKAFADWWQDRLLSHCYDDLISGVYMDQRWLDIAPIFFDRLFILRDPSCNVGLWNLSQRDITMSQEGAILVNGEPLRFFNFDGPRASTKKYSIRSNLPKDHIVREIWDWYSKESMDYGLYTFGKLEWEYDRFNNGERITDEMRRYYRQNPDVQKRFPDPFDTQLGRGGFYGWWRKNKPGDSSGLIRRLTARG